MDMRRCRVLFNAPSFFSFRSSRDLRSRNVPLWKITRQKGRDRRRNLVHVCRAIWHDVPRRCQPTRLICLAVRQIVGARLQATWLWHDSEKAARFPSSNVWSSVPRDSTHVCHTLSRGTLLVVDWTSSIPGRCYEPQTRNGLQTMFLCRPHPSERDHRFFRPRNTLSRMTRRFTFFVDVTHCQVNGTTLGSTCPARAATLDVASHFGSTAKGSTFLRR